MKAKDYIGLGPCVICGYRDAGHRSWGAIAERVRAGESERSVADDYDLTIHGVRSLIIRSQGSDTESEDTP